MSHSPDSAHPTSAPREKGDVEAMPAAFAEFLANALPMDGRSHTLALGETHIVKEHMEWLRQHLGEMKDCYGIQTIGIEKLAWFNVFLWAYQDGTLETELGNKETAREYLRAVFLTYADAGPEYRESALARAELAIAAMDAGIDVVTYDSRNTFRQYLSGLKTNMRELAIAREYFANQQGVSVEELAKLSRQHPMIYFESFGNPTDRFAWLIGEVDWLLNLHAQKPKITNYAAKLKPIEDLVKLGHQKIIAGKLTSDGLSATLFTALAGKGNRLTIGGSLHTSGIANKKPKLPERHPSQVHGTFAHQLEAVINAPQLHWGKAPSGGCRVTSALIATDIVHHHIANIHSPLLDDPQTTAIADNPPAHLDLTAGTVGEMWHPWEDHPRVGPIEDMFPTPKSKPTLWQRLVEPNHIAAHINPLLMPDIARAAAKVRSAVHEPEGKERA